MSSNKVQEELAKLVFDGQDAEDFILAVRRIAIQDDKLSNPYWVARVVSGCFVGEALRWHLGLDEATKTNWWPLEAELFKMFALNPRRVKTSVKRRTGSDSADRTLNKKLIQSSEIRIGRIKLSVHGQGMEVHNGYISKTFQQGQFWRTAVVEEALEVDFVPYALDRIEFVVRGAPNIQKLGLACDAEPSNFTKNNWQAPMVCITGAASPFPGKVIATFEAWEVLSDGTIEPVWKTLSSSPFYLYTRFNIANSRVYAVSRETDSLVPGVDCLATLTFEEI